mmetsp:Transcript_13111/g.24141  ORF Transcript_13111/g.24141 Transcript_13111/m.24141 type:complete len:400 (-) Transcript_13111:176-1375(-)
MMRAFGCSEAMTTNVAAMRLPCHNDVLLPMGSAEMGENEVLQSEPLKLVWKGDSGILEALPSPTDSSSSSRKEPARIDGGTQLMEGGIGGVNLDAAIGSGTPVSYFPSTGADLPFQGRGRAGGMEPVGVIGEGMEWNSSQESCQSTAESFGHSDWGHAEWSHQEATNAANDTHHLHHPAESSTSTADSFSHSDWAHAEWAHADEVHNSAAECRWHNSAKAMGTISEDGHIFTKVETRGKRSILNNRGAPVELSPICMVFDASLRRGGFHQFHYQILDGELGAADGAGFVFDKQVRRNNIQRIRSVFLNQRGRICVRNNGQVTKLGGQLPPLSVGMCLELLIDLDNQWLRFSVYNGAGTLEGTGEVSLEGRFGLEDGAGVTSRSGFFCAVVTKDVCISIA